jgi:hypothetical protein
MTTPRSLVALAIAGAALVPAAVLATPALGKTPTKHVICDKAAKWIPVDYTGGCYLMFSKALRTMAYDAFVDSAEDMTQWLGHAGADLQAANHIKSMKCSRGGTFNGLKLNRFHTGSCTWTDTWVHFNEGDHPTHTWGCEVTMVLRSGLGGKTRNRRGRLEMQWTVTAAPLQRIVAVGAQFPFCDKKVPEDTYAVEGQ